MQIEKIEFDQIRYNPEHGAFEALVKIHDAGETFTYPARLCAPIHAEFDRIARGLVQTAAQAHTAPEPGLRLHRAPQARSKRPNHPPFWARHPQTPLAA